MNHHTNAKGCQDPDIWLHSFNCHHSTGTFKNHITVLMPSYTALLTFGGCLAHNWRTMTTDVRAIDHPLWHMTEFLTSPSQSCFLASLQGSLSHGDPLSGNGLSSLARDYTSSTSTSRKRVLLSIFLVPQKMEDEDLFLFYSSWMSLFENQNSVWSHWHW